MDCYSYTLNAVGTTANEEDYQLSEMVSFVELFNTTVEKVQEVLPKLTEVCSHCALLSINLYKMM